MAGKRWTLSWVGIVLLGMLGGSGPARASDTEATLLQRIQRQNNPVKKAKDEIKLANLKLAQAREAYSQGQVESGAKLLGAFLGEMKKSWKLLQDSGRNASKRPEGFRELEIALREDVRELQDLARAVSYFDRAPLLDAAKEVEQMRSEVLAALFPMSKPRSGARAPAPRTANPGRPPEAR